ncbi:MAG: hypothetical protein GY703_22515 [Gammaproteobacteria bacterium]|nr:hypothetical protein [Gammaproteobacteria bacterium]
MKRESFIRYLLSTAALWSLLFGVIPFAAAQSPSVVEDDLEVSYIYAAVLGTGTYRIGGRHITMLHMPFSWSMREPTDNTFGWKWLLPVVAGYDDLSGVDSNWVDSLRPNQMVTLTFLPGIELEYPVSPRWVLKPFAQIGVARDFSVSETIYMTQLGVRSLSMLDVQPGWELRWGNSLRWAAEYQSDSGDRLSMGLFETGLDIRKDTSLRILDRSTDIGSYLIYQRIFPAWISGDAPDFRTDTENVLELGISVGLKKPFQFLGVDFKRLRLGYKYGDSFRGWVIGTDFPF